MALTTTGAIRVVDTYFHSGALQYVPWRKVHQAHRKAGISGGVAVQHLAASSNEYLRENYARARGYAAVAMVQDAAAAKAVIGDEDFIGVRLQPDGPGWTEHVALADANHKSVFVFARDGIGAYRDQLRQALREAPSATFVLTHSGMSLAGAPDDHRAVRELSAFPNAVLQVSGLNKWSVFPYDDCWAEVGELVEAYGAERSVWGSNYPASSTVGELDAEVELMRGNPLGLGRADLEAFLAGTARRLWPALGSEDA